MSDKTKIAWTEASWNTIAGCTKVSPGCTNCYAERMAVRLANILHPSTSQYRFGGVIDVFASDKKAGWTGKIECSETKLDIPLHWKKPRHIFVNSMSDTFHKDVPFEFIDKIFATMALCPQHTFQCLSKRPEIMAKYFKSIDNRSEMIAEGALRPPFGLWDDADAVYDQIFDQLRNYQIEPLPNIWLGTTCENQEQADKRIPILLQIPAAVRFLSIEPMLGEIDLRQICDDGKKYFDCLTGWWTRYKEFGLGSWQDNESKIDWVIVGAESGHNRRPCKQEWVESIVDQCKAAGVACFVKQLDINGKVEKDIEKFPKHLRIREYLNG